MHADRADLRGEAQAQADLMLEKSTPTKSALMFGTGQSPTSAGRGPRHCAEVPIEEPALDRNPRGAWNNIDHLVRCRLLRASHRRERRGSIVTTRCPNHTLLLNSQELHQVPTEAFGGLA
jgi:hypothetical protein